MEILEEEVININIELFNFMFLWKCIIVTQWELKLKCFIYNVAPLLWPSVGVKPNTWKSRELESSGTPECSELNSKA
jgi:hypothetical protein